jgi:hypothetical protein
MSFIEDSAYFKFCSKDSEQLSNTDNQRSPLLYVHLCTCTLYWVSDLKPHPLSFYFRQRN